MHPHRLRTHPQKRRAGHLQDRPWSRAARGEWLVGVARSPRLRRCSPRIGGRTRPLTGGAVLKASRRCAVGRQSVMATHVLGYGPEDPVALVESCYRAVEWILATHTAKGLLIPRSWIDHPYGEEEITLLEEELLPAMAVFLARVEAIDRAIEADQALEVVAHQAR